MQAPIQSSLALRYSWNLLFLILSLGPSARAADLPLRVTGSARDLAFARFVASHGQTDSFGQTGRVVVLIEASLPELYKSAVLVALRTNGASERRGLQILQLGGDGTVTEEVIERYLVFREQIEELPPSLTAVTPLNYKFRYGGEVRTGGSTAYIYHITPKKRRPGLLAGSVWVDSSSGWEVFLAGRRTGEHSTGDRFELVRDTNLINGFPFSRTTHVTFTIPRLGRAVVTVTEFVVGSGATLQPDTLGSTHQ